MEAADGAILLFDVTNEQSFVNLVSDENNSRQIKRSWMKELRFKAKGDKHPVVILGMPIIVYSYSVMHEKPTAMPILDGKIS